MNIGILAWHMTRINSLFLLFFLCACSFFKEKKYSFLSMGTKFSLKYYTKDISIHEGLISDIKKRIKDLELIFSDYRYDSESMQLAAHAYKKPIPVSKDFAFVWNFARKMYLLTEGVFDVSLGRLTRYIRKNIFIGAEKLTQLQSFVGMNFVEWNSSKNTLFLKKKGIYFDFGAIVKGYVNDEVKFILNAYGIKSFYIQFGGEILLGDSKPNGKKWKIALTNKNSDILYLSNKAVSSSGDYFSKKKGYLYSHIITKNKQIQKHKKSQVTVIADSGILADVLSTSIFSLGEKQSEKLLFNFYKENNIEVYFY